MAKGHCLKRAKQSLKVMRKIFIEPLDLVIIVITELNSEF